MKVCILDKDGTLTTPKSGQMFVQSPDDQVLLPGVAEAIAQLKSEGFVLAIASNQGGVAAGKKTLKSALDEMIYAMQLTGIDLAMIAHTYENYGDGEAVFVDRLDNGEYRKSMVVDAELRFRNPHPGMIQFLSSFMLRESTDALDLVIFVGDREEDKSAAEAAGVVFFWADDWIKDYSAIADVKSN